MRIRGEVAICAAAVECRSKGRYGNMRNYVPHGRRTQDSSAFGLWQRFVERALAVAFEVERHVGEPGALECLRDGGRSFLRKCAVHFFRGDFDASEFVMETHTELAETKFAQGGFTALDHGEALRGDFSAVGHARSEACGGRAVPRRQSGTLRKLANFRFAQTHVEEWRQHAMFFCGAMAGAEVQRVVGVDSVGCGSEAAFLRDGIQHGEKFVLAIKTAVGGVGAIGGVSHFVRVDKFVSDLEDANDFVNGGAVMRGKTWGKGSDGKGALAKCALRGPRQVCGVGASGERDDQRAGLGKTGKERKLFLFRRNTRIFCNANWNERSHREISITQS